MGPRLAGGPLHVAARAKFASFLGSLLDRPVAGFSEKGLHPVDRLRQPGEQGAGLLKRDVAVEREALRGGRPILGLRRAQDRADPAALGVDGGLRCGPWVTGAASGREARRAVGPKELGAAAELTSVVEGEVEGGGRIGLSGAAQNRADAATLGC